LRTRAARPAAPEETAALPAPKEPAAQQPEPETAITPLHDLEAPAEPTTAAEPQAAEPQAAARQAAAPRAEAPAKAMAVPDDAAEVYVEAVAIGPAPISTAPEIVPQPPVAESEATVETPPAERGEEPVTAEVAHEDEAAIAVPLAPEDATPPRGGGDSLLLIEDDEKVAKYYAMIFEARGYRVSVANDGVAGVDMATRLHPGLILLDVMMPRQNGMMVLQTLRATPATEDTPIVILSNFTEPTLIQRALQLGAVEYVVKTQVQAEALANAVPKWLHRERAFA